MGWRSFFSKPIASWFYQAQYRWAHQPIETQTSQFNELVKVAKSTWFGKEHDFDGIQNYQEFKERVPIRDYEDIKPYIKRILSGERDVMWKGSPLYFSKTSGTTSGTKYIPLTRESIPNHIHSARNALFSYIHESGNSQVLDGKLIFLSGSPEVDNSGPIPTGRLSGIVNHHIPYFFKMNQMPTYKTNCVEDWEEKVDAIIQETLQENMTLISGIPPWVQMYFDRIIEKTGKSIKEIFPAFSLFIHGGVNFEPYKAKLFDSIGKEVDSIETYPASEGFIAYQDSREKEGLLAVLNSGIFFEFIPADNFFEENPPRYHIGEVELGVNYAVIINNNAGLWGYNIGDTVKFVSRDPYRLIVTGRIKHFISAFGEHVIGEEVEKAMKLAQEKHQEVEVVEFTVAPQVTPEGGLPLHEWYIEFSTSPQDLSAFEKDLNLHLQNLNPYYNDLISGRILRNLEVIRLSRDSFRDYMKSIGKLGGQNKVPRLSNDRKIADELSSYRL